MQVSKLSDDVLLLPSFIKMPLMKLSVTTTALRTSRGVILISPGKEIAAQSSAVSHLGRVTDLVAPDLFHHESLHLAQREFPQATIWGVDGFRAKRPDLAWDKTLTANTWSYLDEVQVVEIKGVPKLNECVFFHSASKTLVVTDLFMNVLKPKGIGSWFILKRFDSYKKFSLPKFYLKLAEDLEAFKVSLQKMLEFDFETVVMAHGTPLTQDARATVRRALEERDLL